MHLSTDVIKNAHYTGRSLQTKGTSLSIKHQVTSQPTAYIATTHFALDKVRHNLVVEVVNGSPFYPFTDILFLFCLQCELNEYLLELLINKVDAKLFKTIFLTGEIDRRVIERVVSE